MTTNISQLYDQAVTGNAPQDIGIGGFKLYSAILTRINYPTRAPTVYLENGVAIADHLINDPIELNISVNISEVFKATGVASGVENLVRRTQAEVGVVTKYLPARSKAAEQQINSVIDDIDNAYNALDTFNREGEQLFDFFGDKTQASIQADFFDFIDKTRNSKHLISVETPFRTYDNMAILSPEMQLDNQQYATGVNIRLQEMRFVETQTGRILPSKDKRASGTGGDTESEENKGDQKGTKTNSIAQSLVNFF